MSEQAGNEPESVEIPRHGDAAFSSLMDALAPEPDGEAAGSGAPAADAGGAAAGQPAGEGTAPGAPAAPDAGGADPGAGATPDSGGAADQPDAPSGEGSDGAGTEGAGAGGTDAGPPSGDRPAGWTQTAAELTPKLGELSTKFEERNMEAYQATALEEVQTEYNLYFEALKTHPRSLVGQEVPRVDGGEGMETLRDEADARSWQEAVKQSLVEEVRDRASRQLDENQDFLTTIHASIDLFKNNADLIPGTKEFDVELANRFAVLATPYELRHEGKLQGYSIPVQPLIENIRNQIATERAAAAKAAPATPETPAAGGATSTPATPAAGQQQADPPQAGIPSKAGQGDQGEDFSTLFGTIGLPDFRV